MTVKGEYLIITFMVSSVAMTTVMFCELYKQVS